MVEYTRFVDGIVHEPTQTEGRGLDLTVADIYESTEPGRVDFGGGELEDATVAPHESEKRDPATTTNGGTSIPAPTSSSTTNQLPRTTWR